MASEVYTVCKYEKIIAAADEKAVSFVYGKKLLFRYVWSNYVNRFFLPY